MRGHAGYAAEGKDIVCAAASTLCNTFVAYLVNKSDIAVKYNLDKGAASVVVKMGKKNSEVKEVAFFVALGFVGIECAYPKFFRVSKNF